jgi:hypothetical protein
MKTILVPILLLLIAFSFNACKKADVNVNTNNGQPDKAHVMVKLKDGPSEYDHVYVDIQQVEITVEGHAAVTITPVRTGVYDLLKFRNGIDTLLAEADLPLGKISQMRLILGSNNSVVVNDTTYALNTPSAQESGLKLNLKETLEGGKTYTFWIDFDAGRSVIKTGNGSYILKPVMRAYSEQTNGVLYGTAWPAAQAEVLAVNGTDTFCAIPNPDGYFMFSGLVEGSYTLWISAPGYQVYSQAFIYVSYTVKINLGTITLVIVP